MGWFFLVVGWVKRIFMNSNSKSDCIDKIMSKFGGLSGGLSDLDIFDAMAFIDYGFLATK